jgi:hypothetical protein
MASNHFPLPVAALVASVLLPMAASAAGDSSALQGCWRGQMTQYTLKDGSVRRLNGNCVVRYGDGRYVSQCKGATSSFDRTYAYEVTQPGTVKTTPLDANGAPAGPAVEVKFRIDADWLTVGRDLEVAADAPPNANKSFSSVSVRTDPKDCTPRPESTLRIPSRRPVRWR